MMSAEGSNSIMVYSNLFMCALLVLVIGIIGGIVAVLESLKANDKWPAVNSFCSVIGFSLVAYSLFLPRNNNLTYIMGIRENIFYLAVSIIGLPHLLKMIFKRSPK